MKIGFVGLGRMGRGMSERLLDAGFDLAVYDAFTAATAPFAERGVNVAGDVASLASDRDVVITMLAEDAIAELVATGPAGLIVGLAPGGIHMICGTHGVPLIERLTEAHHAAGQVLVTCTVLGRPDRAAEGKLGLITGGPNDCIERLMPIFSALGETVFRAGELAVSSTVAKIANNFVLGCAIEAIGEGMALARRYGVDPHLFQDILTSGLFDCVAYRAYGAVIADEAWDRVGATATIGLKDAQLAIEAAERVSVPLPSGNVWRDHLVSACARGEQGLDWSVMAREQFRASALE
ncbi:MAG: NAD(P)-dependent oxidoreductase [Janthinobacterium lividum]